MKYSGLPFSLFLLLLAAAIALACGSPMHAVAPNCASAPTALNNGMPQALLVCPAVADAKDSPTGEVDFAAIGSFLSGPSPALPTQVIWGACQANAPTTGVTVNSSGVAHCASGASGTYTVWATGGPVLCNVVGPCGACGKTGTAQLTCP
jgi:hypothetical protein